MIEIIIDDHRWKKELFKSKKAVKTWVRSTCLNVITFLQKDKETNISILLTDDKTLRDLNKKFRNKDKNTNVLSFQNLNLSDESFFPCDHCDISFGEIAIAYGVSEEESKTQNKKHKHHVTHLLVHGVLHLCGYDHEQEDEAEIMENIERKILEKLSIQDPYSCIIDKEE